MAKALGKGRVFAVHKYETADGKSHEVIWAKDGNLNAAVKRGNIKRFRLWAMAKRFAVNKAEQIHARLSIS